MKKILLLGGSAQQVIAIETAKRLGYYTILCDFLDDNPGQYVADRFYLESTTDKEKMLEIAKAENIDGVLAYASDPAAPTAAYIAEKMGLPGNPVAAVETLCNKDVFRAFLQKNGFNAPSSMGYSSIDEAKKDINKFSYPIIIKPVDSSGSKGITVLHSNEGIEKALDFAFSFSRAKRIIVENYIEKKHPYLIGGDIFVINGEVRLWGLMNCHRDSEVNPLVPVGKSWPLLLDKNDEDNVKDTLRRLVKLLNFNTGAMNVELVVDNNNKVWPIDIGPRCGGNMIPDLLGLIFNVDIPKVSVQAAMGESVEIFDKANQGYFSTYNLHSKQDGIFQDIILSPAIEENIVKTCIYKKRNEEVSYFDNASKALGILFLKFNSSKDMLERMNNMNDYVSICINNVRGGGNNNIEFMLIPLLNKRVA